MNFEAPYYSGDKQANTMKGFFVAPKTTRYRFYQSCDDKCIVNFALNSSQPDNMTEIMSNHGATGHRAYFRDYEGKTLISEWFNLTEGEKYAIEARHIEYNGGDHLTVSVEVE